MHYHHINVDVFECGDGCDPSVSNECINEYIEDMFWSWFFNFYGDFERRPNAFVEKFACSNIDFQEAIIGDYNQCRAYPVFPALFYDYDSILHQQMIVDQLSPYTQAIGSCIVKLFEVFFIWFFIKALIFPFYFALTEAIASHCCDAIRQRKVVEIDLATVLKVKKTKKRKNSSYV